MTGWWHDRTKYIDFCTHNTRNYYVPTWIALLQEITCIHIHAMGRSRIADDALFNMSCAFSLVQLPVTLALISYYKDPLFAMYTTNLLNTTTKEMDIEVENFSASILYTMASASVSGI